LRLLGSFRIRSEDVSLKKAIHMTTETAAETQVTSIAADAPDSAGTEGAASSAVADSSDSAASQDTGSAAATDTPDSAASQDTGRAAATDTPDNAASQDSASSAVADAGAPAAASTPPDSTAPSNDAAADTVRPSDAGAGKDPGPPYLFVDLYSGDDGRLVGKRPAWQVLANTKGYFGAILKAWDGKSFKDGG
jgi:hypothetical protein